MNSRIIPIFVLSILLLSPAESWGQTVLDDVRQNILSEGKEEIKSVSEEIKKQKKLQAEERERKRKEFREKIERARKISEIEEKERAIIEESEDLIEAIKERTEYESEKRWRYQELIKIYAEKPVEEMSLEEKEETANQFLASATSDLIDLLKRKAIQKAKQKRGEEYEDVVASGELLVQLKQYTQLVKLIESSKEAQTEKIVQKKEDVVKSTQELIELFKEEALRRAEAKRIEEEAKKEIEEKRPIEGTIGVHYGYDDNVNADKAFEGGQFVRNYFSLNWVPSFNDYLKADIGTWYLADNFVDDQDVSFRITAGQTSLKWYPFGNDKLEITPGFEFSDTHYPNNATLSTKDKKIYITAKHTFWKNWSQELTYEDVWIRNKHDRLARDGAGNDKAEERLEKHRHIVQYDLGLPLPFNTTFKLKQKGTFQTSNDSFTDFYDYNAYKITGELGRVLTQKLYAKASMAYEPKYYTKRTVSAHQVAQEDKVYTQKVSFFYFWDDDWLLNYTWTRTKTDSNDTLYDYEKMTHLLGMYYSF